MMRSGKRIKGRKIEREEKIIPLREKLTVRLKRRRR
jgi:hypothetical protein